MRPPPATTKTTAKTIGFINLAMESIRPRIMRAYLEISRGGFSAKRFQVAGVVAKPQDSTFPVHNRERNRGGIQMDLPKT